MNDASVAMKEWRRAQTSLASPLAVQVPESVMQASQSFVGSLWAQAQELANESLRAAQAGWESEREELDVMRQELADAYESQAAELEQAAARLAELEKSEATAKADVADLRGKVAEVGERAETSEARASELRAEHRAEMKELRSEFAEQRKQTAQEMARQAERYTKLQAGLDARERMLAPLVRRPPSCAAVWRSWIRSSKVRCVRRKVEVITESCCYKPAPLRRGAQTKPRDKKMSYIIDMPYVYRFQIRIPANLPFSALRLARAPETGDIEFDDDVLRSICDDIRCGRGREEAI